MMCPIIKIKVTENKAPSLEDPCMLNATKDTMLDYLTVMLHQEEHKYKCKNYFSKIPSSMKVRFVDEECREKMIGWCFHIIDSFDYDRELMCFTISYLDRYLQTVYGWEALESREHFKTAVLSSLYLAIKTNHPEVLNPQTLSTLSQIPEEEIIRTEMKILSSLDWKLHPPTPFSYLPIYFSQMHMDEINNKIYQVISYQIELSVCYYSYAQVKPSVISYAALANAIQLFDADSTSLPKLRHIAKISESEAVRVQKMLIQTLTLNLETKNVIYMSLRLPHDSNQIYHSKEEEEANESILSPRSVSFCSTKNSARPDGFFVPPHQNSK